MTGARPAGDRADALPALAEVFRDHGFEGASLTLISQRTGLGKGSLYHFFPGGKDEMAAAVLDDVDAWFERRVFRPLRDGPDPRMAIGGMLRDVDAYFQSGQRICLMGALALGEVRSRFAPAIARYFTVWRDVLADALHRAGHDRRTAEELAEDAISLIEGALVTARALDDPMLFARTLGRLRQRLGARG